MSAPKAAAALGTNRTGISNLEAGRFGVSVERVRTLARIYSCSDQALVDALATMAAERSKGWWDEYREVLPTDWLDLAELEYRAEALRSMQTLYIPGLLQTEEHAKAVFAITVPELTPVELRRRLSHRMKRRDILDREQPPQCTFLIHEAALRIPFGGRRVAEAQLQHILEASERDNITIRVIPFSAGAFPNPGGPLLYALGAVPELDTVHLEAGHGSVLLHTAAHLSNYRAILNKNENLSLNPQKTRDLILDISRAL